MLGRVKKKLKMRGGPGGVGLRACGVGDMGAALQRRLYLQCARIPCFTKRLMNFYKAYIGLKTLDLDDCSRNIVILNFLWCFRFPTF